MSHFGVLVIGENPEKQLQPYHEYECTGIKDEYVVDVDMTDQIDEWLKKDLFVGTSKETGKLDYHYYEDTANENLDDITTMKRSEYFEKIGTSLDIEIVDYFGAKKKDGIWVRYTNPNAKWDWYVLGGRWTGYFKLKDGAVGTVGKPGLMTDPANKGFADALLKRDLDIEGMRKESVDKAIERYDKAMSIIGHLPVNKTWEELSKEYESNISEARNVYWAQPRCKVWQSNSEVNQYFGYMSSPDSFIVSKEEYVEDARNNALVTFAMVKDSKWYEKGKMGWWGVVTDKTDSKVWAQEFNKIIDELPEDTLLSFYDCHI